MAQWELSHVPRSCCSIVPSAGVLLEGLGGSRWFDKKAEGLEFQNGMKKVVAIPWYL